MCNTSRGVQTWAGQYRMPSSLALVAACVLAGIATRVRHSLASGGARHACLPKSLKPGNGGPLLTTDKAQALAAAQPRRRPCLL